MPDHKSTVSQFNAAHPVGTSVRYWSVLGDPDTTTETRTRSTAYVLSGHTPVVFLEGVSGCVALAHVEVLIDCGAERCKGHDPEALPGSGGESCSPPDWWKRAAAEFDAPEVEMTEAERAVTDALLVTAHLAGECDADVPLADFLPAARAAIKAAGPFIASQVLRDATLMAGREEINPMLAADSKLEAVLVCDLLSRANDILEAGNA